MSKQSLHASTAARFVAIQAVTLCFAASAMAQSADVVTPPQVVEPAKDIRSEVPLVGYTMSAFGASRMTAGAAAFAGLVGGTAAPVGSESIQSGARIWGSPIDRLTILFEVSHRPYSDTAPSATVTGRIFGSRAQGWAVGAMLSYKTDGFAELAGEVEGGLLLSVERRGFHADTNLVFGGGVEEEELDGEWKFRAGYDVNQFVRLGIDGRMRYRMGGDRKLRGDRLGDALGGPEVVLGDKNFFLSASGGPSTVGIQSGIGWSTSLTVGGALL